MRALQTNVVLDADLFSSLPCTAPSMDPLPATLMQGLYILGRITRGFFSCPQIHSKNQALAPSGTGLAMSFQDICRRRSFCTSGREYFCSVQSGCHLCVICARLLSLSGSRHYLRQAVVAGFFIQEVKWRFSLFSMKICRFTYLDKQRNRPDKRMAGFARRAFTKVRSDPVPDCP